MNIQIGITDGGGTAIFRRKPHEIPIIVCVHCGVLVTEHPRCKTCEVLTHVVSYPCHCGTAHTLTTNGEECTDCERLRVEGPREYDLTALSYLSSTLL